MSAATVPLQSVVRALARLSDLSTPRATPNTNGAGGDSRAAILGFIESAHDVVRVEEIANGVGLHPNTVRGHLDALLAAGRITRIPDQRATRGRPHWLYSATAAASVRELARTLSEELDRASAPDAVRLAAAGWAEAGPDIAPAASMDEAVDDVTRALAEFGFEAVHNPLGDEITLRSCPYAQLVDEHPVICDIHAELLGVLLSRTGQPVTLRCLEVFPRSDICVARLNRPDIVPRWTVELPEPTDPHAPATPSRRKK